MRVVEKILFSGFCDFAVEECFEALVVYFDDLESYAWHVSFTSTHAASDSFEEDFVVFVDHFLGAVAWHECGDLFAVFDELAPCAFSHRAVWLFGLPFNFGEDDCSGLAAAFEWVALVFCSEFFLCV